MEAEVITIGDEILIGQVADTNSAFIAKSLDKIGISVRQITSIRDSAVQIKDALSAAQEQVRLVVMTGGLGPTKDDITKQTLCEHFGDTLVEDKGVLQHIEYLFSKYFTTPISELNRKQAWVPSRAVVLPNPNGTAPGMWMEHKGTVFVSLPGVPFEMRHLIQEEVLPRLSEKFNRPNIYHRTLITQGMGESLLADTIADWEDALPDTVKLAYLPSLAQVRLRLSAIGEDRKVLEEVVAAEVDTLRTIIGAYIKGEEDGDSIEQLTAKLLTDKGLSLGVAESCTGGKLAGLLTGVPGASAYFKGGVVSYATEVKEDLLGVPHDLVAKHSVVSAAVAESMAQNVRELLKADVGLATTGNAGPTKGDSDAEIGTVFIAVATPKGVCSQEFMLGSQRERIVEKALYKALELLQLEISKF